MSSVISLRHVKLFLLGLKAAYRGQSPRLNIDTIGHLLNNWSINSKYSVFNQAVFSK